MSEFILFLKSNDVCLNKIKKLGFLSNLLKRIKNLHPETILQSLENRPNIIYGAAQMASFLYEYLNRKKISIEAFVVEEAYLNISKTNFSIKHPILTIDDLLGNINR